MIRKLLPIVCVVGRVAFAAPADESSSPSVDQPTVDENAPTNPVLGEEDGLRDDDPARHRMPLPVLLDRAIGVTARPVAYNWRASPVQFAVVGGRIAELNTFNSARVGGLVRVPSAGAMIEVSASYVASWDSSASRALALTPYVQAGRPSRLEVDALFGVPFAEGIVTAAPRLVPALQLVLNGYVGLRYAVYPTGYARLRPGEVGVALVAPALSEKELANLNDARLDAMEVDPSRYWVVAGLGQDIYLKQGLFVSPRLLVTVPVLAPITGSQLVLAPELSLAVGVAL